MSVPSRRCREESVKTNNIWERSIISKLKFKVKDVEFGAYFVKTVGVNAELTQRNWFSGHDWKEIIATNNKDKEVEFYFHWIKRHWDTPPSPPSHQT